MNHVAICVLPSIERVLGWSIREEVPKVESGGSV